MNSQLLRMATGLGELANTSLRGAAKRKALAKTAGQDCRQRACGTSTLGAAEGNASRLAKPKSAIMLGNAQVPQAEANRQLT